MDPLANMLTKIRNGYQARQERVFVPASKLCHAVATVLSTEGYLTKVFAEEVDKRAVLNLGLRYSKEIPTVERVRRISRPGRRTYVGADSIPRIAGGFGTIILSTSSGVMTGAEAKKRGLGGEVLCEVVRGAQQ